MNFTKLVGKTEAKEEVKPVQSVDQEIRTLTFWRALTAECISSFFYVLLISCITKSSTSSTTSKKVDFAPLDVLHIQVYCGLTSGLAIITLTTIFLPVSGAHISPAVSVALATIRRVSPVRALGHILAQSGGAIAGASVMLAFYGTLEEPKSGHEAVLGLEFLLTYMIVLAYLRVTEHSDSLMASVAIGLSYMTATAAFRGAVNPAFALGRSFVENDFDHLWIFWLGPLLGGACAALCHEYIFNEQRDVHLSLTNVSTTSNQEEDNDEEDTRSHLNSKSISEAQPTSRGHQLQVRAGGSGYNEQNFKYNGSGLTNCGAQHEYFQQPTYSQPIIKKSRAHNRSFSFHTPVLSDKNSQVPNDDIHDMGLISEGINHRQRDRRRHKSGDKFQEGYPPQHTTTGCKYVELQPAERQEPTFPTDQQKFYPVNPRCRSRTLERELVKACTLPRDRDLGQGGREKAPHVTSLHNLCENTSGATPRSRHQHHLSLVY